MSTLLVRLFRVALACSLCILSLAALRADSPDSIEFFENRIRPVLVEHCYQCHSTESEEVGGSLLLDSPGGMIGGGDSGPAIDPGDGDGSLLVAALRYESVEMPPQGRLPEAVIQDFEKWIQAGAIDPRHAGDAPGPRASGIDLVEGRKFWAFQPIAFTPTPANTRFRSSGAIDQFLNEQLASADLQPNGSASPDARLRRLSFDLTGLPPDPMLQKAWLVDPSPRRWRRIVDRMLASPAFGEHWARHWMDVARYADSNGSDFNATHHEAWRYRDYLIRSMAADRPFDQMIRQQIAGDLLPAASDSERHDNVVATTFLMTGPKMLSERDKAKLTLDVVDEQIDTIGRAFLGMTLGCARCHDHKFDPVPTEDYYALAGIFKSTMTLNGESQKYVSTWNRVSLPTSDDHRRQIKQHQSQLASLKADIKAAEAVVKKSGKTQTSYDGVVVDDSDATKTGYWKPSTYYRDFVGTGYVHDDNSGKGDATIRFATRLPHSGRWEVRVSHSPGSNRAAAVPVTIETADGTQVLRLDQRRFKIEPMWSSLGTFEFSRDADAVVTLSNQGTSGYVIADAVQFLRRDGEDADKDDVKDTEKGNRLRLAQDQLNELKQQLKQLQASAPQPLPEAMAPSDRPTHGIADSPVHIRGEVKNVGSVVPRGFLQVCSGGDASIRNPRGSGRMELADWLTDPDNPLVARVFVNRLWMHLMGHGLVRTPDNFGMQGERPTHPKLLDHLATEFVRDGWRIKPTLRRIVNSEAYSRSSQHDEASVAIDPENRLLWRGHRRRLTAESIRDAMIASSGQLDRRPRIEPMKGRGTLVSNNNGNSKASFDSVGRPCRSIYMPVVRGYLPPMMTALDIADPDLLVGRRPTTNVPAQALVLINSPDVNEWARKTAERIVDKASGYEDRLELVSRVCLGRGVARQDLPIAEAFFADRRESIEAWHEYVAAIFASTEFRLLD